MANLQEHPTLQRLSLNQEQVINQRCTALENQKFWAGLLMLRVTLKAYGYFSPYIRVLNNFSTPHPQIPISLEEREVVKGKASPLSLGDSSWCKPSTCIIKIYPSPGLHWWSSGWDSALLMQGAWVRFLVGEQDPICMPQLRSLHDATKDPTCCNEVPECSN